MDARRYAGENAGECREEMMRGGEMMDEEPMIGMEERAVEGEEPVMTELHVDNFILKARVEGLERENGEMKLEHESRVQRFQERAEEKFRVKDAEIWNLKHDLEEMKREAEEAARNGDGPRARLEGEIRRKNKRIGELEEELRRANVRLAEVEAQPGDDGALRALTKTNRKLKKRLNELSELRENQGGARALMFERNRLEDEVERLEKDLRRTKRQWEKDVKKVKEQEGAKLVEELRKLEIDKDAQIKGQGERIDALLAQIDEGKKKACEREKELKRELEKKHGIELDAELKKLKDEYEEKLEKSEDRVRRRDGRIAEQERHLAYYYKKYEDAADKIEAQENKIYELEAKKVELIKAADYRKLRAEAAAAAAAEASGRRSPSLTDYNDRYEEEAVVNRAEPPFSPSPHHQEMYQAADHGQDYDYGHDEFAPRAESPRRSPSFDYDGHDDFAARAESPFRANDNRDRSPSFDAGDFGFDYDEPRAATPNNASPRQGRQGRQARQGGSSGLEDLQENADQTPQETIEKLRRRVKELVDLVFEREAVIVRLHEEKRIKDEELRKRIQEEVDKLPAMLMDDARTMRRSNATLIKEVANLKTTLEGLFAPEDSAAPPSRKPTGRSRGGRQSLPTPRTAPHVKRDDSALVAAVTTTRSGRQSFPALKLGAQAADTRSGRRSRHRSATAEPEDSDAPEDDNAPGPSNRPPKRRYRARRDDSDDDSGPSTSAAPLRKSLRGAFKKQ